jgi:hypothetical protein
MEVLKEKTNFKSELETIDKCKRCDNVALSLVKNHPFGEDEKRDGYLCSCGCFHTLTDDVIEWEYDMTVENYGDKEINIV